jgi:hypothetical protein
VTDRAGIFSPAPSLSYVPWVSENRQHRKPVSENGEYRKPTFRELSFSAAH